jgi:hypothetical protein
MPGGREQCTTRRSAVPVVRQQASGLASVANQLAAPEARAGSTASRSRVRHRLLASSDRVRVNLTQQMVAHVAA